MQNPLSPMSRITELFKKMNPFLSAPSTQRGKMYPNNVNRLYDYFRIENDRKKAYEECWVMYVEDARIAAAIDTTAGSATNGGFTIQFNRAKTKTEQVIKDADDIISNMMERTKLMSMIGSIAKELLILGDCFLEVVVDTDTNEIIKLKKLPARYLWREEDEFGDLVQYVQKDELYQVTAVFEPWQILHLRWNHFSGQKYGTSMLRPIRSTWKKLRMTEEDLVIRRRTRAGVKLHHYGADETNPLEPDEVDEYRAANSSSPLNVRTDWYSNGKWKIEVLKSDDGVSAIEDIKHLEDMLFVGLRTPKGILGLDSGSNRSSLQRQETAYVRLLDEISTEIGHQLKGVMNLALQLQGMNPDAVEFETIWQERTIEDTNKKTERLVLLGNTGYISKQTAVEELGYNYEDERAKIEMERQQMSNIDYMLQFGPNFANPTQAIKNPVDTNNPNSNTVQNTPTPSKQQIPNKPVNDKTGAAKQ
jgi:hypothetical protein